MEHKRWGSETEGISVILVREDEGGAVIRVVGELDAHGAPLLNEAVEYALDGDGGLELDLGRCGFIDSSGLGALVKAHKLCQERERPFALGPISDAVARLLEVSGIGPHLAS
jgi:anti-sigma B factor antagonist